MTEVVLAAHGVSYGRDGRRILTDVDLEVRDGQVVALTGPSGAGKSTLLALLAGLERPDSGSVVRTVGTADTAVVLQAFGLVALLTVEENAAMPLLVPERPALPPAEVLDRTDAALDAVGLLELRDRLVESLSGGQQQRVAIARALVTRPRLLLIDEPTAALDAANRSRVMDLLVRDRPAGTTVVLATHDRALLPLVDRVFAVTDGVLTAAS